MSNLNEVKQVIKTYLDNRAKNDELFSVSYAKKNKSIDECFEYIVGEAKKKGNAVYLPDEVVFGLAVHYYDEDDIEINKLPANAKVTAKTSVELSEDDKEKARKQAVNEYKEQCIKKLKADEEAKAKKIAEKKKDMLEKRKEEELLMYSLFEFD